MHFHVKVEISIFDDVHIVYKLDYLLVFPIKCSIFTIEKNSLINDGSMSMTFILL